MYRYVLLRYSDRWFGCISEHNRHCYFDILSSNSNLLYLLHLKGVLKNTLLLLYSSCSMGFLTIFGTIYLSTDTFRITLHICYTCICRFSLFSWFSILYQVAKYITWLLFLFSFFYISFSIMPMLSVLCMYLGFYVYFSCI